jgi:hypothetical protein
MVVANDWVSPAEFWTLAPGQLWWLIDAKTPEHARNRGPELMEVRKLVRAAKAKEKEAA